MSQIYEGSSSLKALRKILLVGILSAVLLMTLFAGKCTEEYTVEILTANDQEIDLFLDAFDKTPYNFGEGWAFGIIIYKDWVDDEYDGDLSSANIKVRGQDKQTRTISVEETSYGILTDSANKRFDNLRVGDLIAFKETSGLEKMQNSTVRVIMKSAETKFTQVRREHVDFE